MLLLLLLACGDARHQTHSVGGMNAVWIEVSKGNVNLEGGLGAGTLSWDTEGPASVSHRRDRDALHVDGHCSFWLGCQTHLTLGIPRNIPVTAIVGTGNFRLSTLDASLQVQVDKGDVVATDLNSPKVRIQVGWGSVKLHFKGRPQRIDVDVVVGNIEVEVPYALYAVREDATEPESYPDGIPVHLHTTSGTAKLVKRAPVE